MLALGKMEWANVQLTWICRTHLPLSPVLCRC